MKHAKLFWALLAFVLIPTTYYFIKKQNAKELSWHQVSKPLVQDLKQYITASGRLKAQDQITVGSLVAGRIVKLHVDDNDFVKKDQVLVELDNGIGYSAVKKAKAALLQAEANAKYLKAFYKRQKALYKAGQLARDSFEEIRKNYHTAKAQALQAEGDLEIRQQEYNNLFIKAPESGIIISKKVDLGQMITARFQATELFTIAKDLKKMEAEIDVDESDIGIVKVGQEGIFRVDAFPQKAFKSKVNQIHYDYKIIDNVITYAVVLNVNNPNLLLRPGMTTNVDLQVASVKQALCVPNKALRINRTILKAIAEKKGFQLVEIPQTVETKVKESLWILEGKTFKEVHVKLGVTDGRHTQIMKGVSLTTDIIVEALDPNRENPVMSMGKLKV